MGIGIVVAHTAEFIGIGGAGVLSIEDDGLIADEAGRLVDGSRIEPAEAGVGAAADDKEGAREVEAAEATEVDIAAVHDVEGARFRNQDIEHLIIGAFAVGDVDEAGNGAAQVEQRVQLDGALGLLKVRPGKDREAEVDGRGIESIDGLLERDAEVIASIQTPRDGDESLGEVGMDAPIAPLIGISERAARNRGTDAHMVELAPLRSQASLDVAQALAVGELGEGHAEILVEAGEARGLVITAIARHAATESMAGQMIHDLRKDEFADVHASLPNLRAGSTLRRIRCLNR